MTKQFEFIYRDKVRYCDCDMHQHLNHARYLCFFEQARVEYFAKLGFGGKDYKSIPFILVSAHCDYRAPAYLNDAIEVRVGLTSIGKSSFRLDYEMKNAETGKLLAEAYTVQVMYDYDKMTTIPFPNSLKKKIQATFSGICR